MMGGSPYPRRLSSRSGEIIRYNSKCGNAQPLSNGVWIVPDDCMTADKAKYPHKRKVLRDESQVISLKERAKATASESVERDNTATLKLVAVVFKAGAVLGVVAYVIIQMIQWGR